MKKTLTLDEVLQELHKRKLVVSYTPKGRIRLLGPAIPFSLYKDIRMYSNAIMALQLAFDSRVCPSPVAHAPSWYEVGEFTFCLECERLAA